MQYFITWYLKIAQLILFITLKISCSQIWGLDPSVGCETSSEGLEMISRH